MSTYRSMRIIWPLIVGGLFGLATSAAFADEWPITYAKLQVPASAYGGAQRTAPEDCQPEPFDPATTKYHPAAPGASANKDAAAPVLYQIEGDDAATMTIDSVLRQDDAKTTLPEPYTLTKYVFGCKGQASQVFEFKKDGKRYALYTHVTQAGFSPDLTKLVLYNYAKPHHGPWQELRRVIELRTRRFTPLPVINETAFLAGVAEQGIVTYGPAVAGKQKLPHRIAAVWGLNGKLLRALSVPAPAGAGNERGDAIGLLPDDPSAFYYLTRTGENTCTLRLQDLRRPEGRRSIELAVPGAAGDPAGSGTRVQIDLAGLRLKDGAMKYRVSASGKGDVANDWSAWQAAK